MLHHHLPLLLSRSRHALDFSQAWNRRKAALGRSGGRWWRAAGKGKPPFPIHYHISKNAGTSFEWALEQTLGATCQQFDSAVSHGYASARDLVEFSFRHPEITAISSPQAVPPAPRIFGRQVITRVLIRDRIERIPPDLWHFVSLPKMCCRKSEMPAFLGEARVNFKTLNIEMTPADSSGIGN